MADTIEDGSALLGNHYTVRDMARHLDVTTATIRNYAKHSAFMPPIVDFRGKQKRFLFTEQHKIQWKKTLTDIQNGRM